MDNTSQSYSNKKNEDIELYKKTPTLRNITPKNDLFKTNPSEYAVYKKELDDALLKDNQVTNIAITGGFGSGKTSIVNSYLNDPNSEVNTENCLRISFANFSKRNEDLVKNKLGERGIPNRDEDESNKKLNKEFNDSIFVNIINQIIYQIPSQLIPLSRFRIKQRISKFTIFVLIFEVLIVSKKILKLLVSQMDSLIDAIGLFGMAWLLYILISKIDFHHMRFAFKNYGAEIDYGPDSQFERYTDELIYIFTNAPQRIIIVEDLDRFGDLEIFEKLRELNNKLNNQNDKNRKNLKNSNQNARWRFIYLLKDELFEDQKERVKFFEQTIPVLPHVTTANSGDRLQEELSNYDIDSKLFRIIGTELDDERLLLSIANDFEHHKYLMPCDDNNQLLALIAYKNFNPRAFNQLQNGKDELATLRNEFGDIISQQIKDKQENLDHLENLKISDETKKKIELLQNFFSDNRISYEQRYNYGTTEQAIIEDIINSNRKISIDEKPKLPFSDLVKSNPDIKGKIQVSKYDDEIEQFKENILALKYPDFCDIDSEILEDRLPSFIFKLVENGFIRINYRSIVNHFYGDENIQQLLNNILIDRKKQYDLLIDSPKDAYDKIDKSDFGKEETLNYDLVIWMFDNNKAELDNMIEIGSRQSDGFIEKLINRRPDIYSRVMIAINPFFEFNLDLLNPIDDVSGIASSNLYRADTHNYQILVDWMNQKFFEVKEYLSILNNEEVSEGLKREIVNAKPPLLGNVNLNKISTHLWPLFVEKKLLKLTNSNVNAYISEYGVTRELVDFVNQGSLVIDEEIPVDSLIQFLKIKQLNNSSFEELFTNVKDISPKVLVDADYRFIQKLFDENKILIDDGIVELIKHYGVVLPVNYKNDDLRDQLIKDDEKLQTNLIKELLNSTSDKNEMLFYTYLDQFEIDYILTSEFIDRDTRQKLGYVVKRIKRYTTRTFTNNEYNKLLLNRLCSGGYIDGFEVKDNGRLRLIFKK